MLNTPKLSTTSPINNTDPTAKGIMPAPAGIIDALHELAVQPHHGLHNAIGNLEFVIQQRLALDAGAPTPINDEPITDTCNVEEVKMALVNTKDLTNRILELTELVRTAI